MTDVLHTVLETDAYLSKAAKIMSDEEREEVLTALAKSPFSGKLIKGTGGLRKVRFGLKGAWQTQWRSRHLLVSFRTVSGLSSLGLRKERGR